MGYFKTILAIGLLIYVQAFSQNVLSPEIMLSLKRLSEPSVSPDGKTILYVVETIDLEKNGGTKAIFSIPIDGGMPHQLSSTEENSFTPRWLPNGKRINYISGKNGQWYEMETSGDPKIQVTNSSIGIGSISYSADSTVVISAEVEGSNTLQELYPDVKKSSAKIIDDLFYRTWNQWDDSRFQHLWIAKGNKGLSDINAFEDIQKKEPYDVEEFDVSISGKYIAYSSKKLSGKEFAKSTNNDIYLYNVESKSTLNISAGMPGYDLHPKFSRDGKKLCWTSMPTNGIELDESNLMCYDLTTKKINYYIQNLGENIDVFEWSADNRLIYFLKETEGTVQLYALNCASKKIKQITKGKQDYTSLAIAGNYAVLLKTSFILPDELVKINLQTGEETQLTFTNKATLDKLKFGREEINWIKTTDNKQLQTLVFYPPDFDSTKKYPTILYCQGGPQVGISQAFSYRWNLQLMCAKGYIVVAPNRRGVPGFGKAWKDQISEDWGGQSIQDYLSAIDSIAKRPYVDVTRIAAVGASYGAYSVYWLEGHNESHRFKTFIAHCGVFNLESWYSTTDQTFFGDHELGGNFWMQPLPKSYAQFSPQHFVKNWDTPILVIHNEKDFRVPVSEGMQAFGVAQLKNIKSRFLYFPDEGHWVLKPQNSLVWHREFYRWLTETLN
ncbi:MAG: S9 family peptidase [Bacteroidetes bacterium]|nr:S9 family peptidase [Bacteroidota bacterium]